jgi:hypothetical protein
MINLCFGGQLTDCSSGFRAFRRDRLAAWQASAPGKEFASGLLVNALHGGAKIVEVPITLRRQRSDQRPHLQTWPDGLRHFFTILTRAPWLFLHGGLWPLVPFIVLGAYFMLICMITWSEARYRQPLHPLLRSSWA